jgi:hypothetical protein
MSLGVEGDNLPGVIESAEFLRRVNLGEKIKVGEEVEIVGEALKGIGIGRVTGGRWHGLRLITKAGAFGRENALEKILKQ